MPIRNGAAEHERQDARRSMLPALLLALILLTLVGLGATAAYIWNSQTPVWVGAYVIGGPRWFPITLSDEVAPGPLSPAVVERPRSALDAAGSGRQHDALVTLVWSGGGVKLYRRWAVDNADPHRNY